MLVVSEAQPDARAGNYVFYQIPLQLTRQGCKVYWLFTKYEWKEYEDVVKPFYCISYSDLEGILPQVDAIIWMGIPPPPGYWWQGLRELFNTVVSSGKSLVYYALDYWEGWLGESNKELQNEAVMMDRADVVLAVSPQLCTYLASRYRKGRVYWLPNASRAFPPAQGVKKEKIVVIASSFYQSRDPSKVMQLACKYPDWQFVWCGGGDRPVKPKVSPPYKKPPNLILPGEVDNFEFMQLASRASLSIVPAGKNWFSYFADPTKWYLYHQLALPVVSVNTPHHKKFPQFYPHTWAGGNLETLFKEALKHLDKVEVIPRDFHTWEHRVKGFLAALEGNPLYGYADLKGFHFTFKEG